MFFNRKSTILTMLSELVSISIFRRLIPVLGSICFIIWVSYVAWKSLGPEKPVPDTARQYAAQTVARDITEVIRKNSGDTTYSAVLLHFANDPTDYFTDSLRASLNATGVLNLEDRTIAEKLRNKLNLKNHGCASNKEAYEMADDDVQAILWGSLAKYQTTKSGVILKGSWQLLDRKSKTTICEGTFNYDTTSKGSEAVAKVLEDTKIVLDKELSVFSAASRSIPGFVRFLGFVLVVLLLPIITIAYLRTMVAKRSNKVNAFVLATYTIVDIILALFMIGGIISFWSVIGFLIASGCAFLYNYHIMCYALKLES